MLQLSRVKVVNLVKLLILIQNVVEMYDLRTEKYLQINLRCGLWSPNLTMHTELVILRQMEDD